MVEKDMSFFMAGKAEKLPETEEIITKRYKDEKGNPIPFKFRAIPVDKVEEYRDLYTREIRKHGQVIDEKFDSDKFKARLGVESTVYPDFKDKALRDSYHEQDPIKVAKAILSVPGEYARWLEVVQNVNGFDEDFDEDVEDAKN